MAFFSSLLSLNLQTTALGRTTSIESERFADGGQHQVTTHSDQTQLDVTTGADLGCTTITTEGTLVEIEAEVDPRFGTQDRRRKVPGLENGNSRHILHFPDPAPMFLSQSDEAQR